ncbi:MAG: hypothetical protein ACLR4Z_18990 [Butyricicoccaceae bacterium]
MIGRNLEALLAAAVRRAAVAVMRATHIKQSPYLSFLAIEYQYTLFVSFSQASQPPLLFFDKCQRLKAPPSRRGSETTVPAHPVYRFEKGDKENEKSVGRQLHAGFAASLADNVSIPHSAPQCVNSF